MNDELCAEQKEEIVQKHHAAAAMFVIGIRNDTE